MRFYTRILRELENIIFLDIGTAEAIKEEIDYEFLNFKNIILYDFFFKTRVCIFVVV